MRTKKERLERKILMTIRHLENSPIGEKERYCVRLEKQFKHYKELTGEDYRIPV